VEDERLTHEWLNAYDALLVGDAKPTLKLVALDKPVPELVRSHLAQLFDGDDEDPDRSKVKVQIKKFGRKKLLKFRFSKSDSIELALVKKLLIERSQLPVSKVEEFMRDKLHTNLTYLRKAVRTGKNLLIDFEKHGHKFDPPSEEELQKKWPKLFGNIRR
tara:strand:+ start:32 stop:511 length:480 start_codon:yes stop_codon:yes gene_type:complete